MKLTQCLFASTLAACFAAPPSHAAEVAEQPMVWAHYTPWHTPLNSSISAYSYYNYPIFHSTGFEKNDYAAEFQQAKSQGIDGFLVDVVFQKKGRPAFDDFVRKMLQAAEGSGFQIGLCLDVKTTVETQVRELSRMLSDYGAHPNYPRHNDRPIVATYTWGKWTPQDWADIRAGLQSAGHNIHLIANVDPNYAQLKRDWLDSYAPHFDTAYSFGLAGINGMPRQQMADLIADAAHAHGKTYMATLYPGYYGAWLNGRNDFYQPHRGFDQLHDTYLAIRQKRDHWLHFTTWNDHDETSVLPMLFTPANPRITKAYSDAFKNIPPTSTKPEICLAYHREEIPGTLLRIEALTLPSLAPHPTAIVSGHLLDQTGNPVATLEPRTLATRQFDRAEWLIPTGHLAHTPALTPRITIDSRNPGDVAHTASLPPILLVNGWHQNTVTVKVPVNECIDIPNTLTIRSNTDTPENGLLDAEISFAYSNATTVPHEADEIASITLFRNDRPLAVFNATTEGKHLFNLNISGKAGWEVKLEDGAILNAVRKFSEKNSPTFTWHAGGAKSSPTPIQLPAGLLCSITPNTQLTLSVKGNEPLTLTAQDLNKRELIQLKNLTITASPVDATVQNHAPLAEQNGHHRITILTRPPRISDMFYVRYETTRGKVALSRIVHPFSPTGKIVPANLIQTSINLETSSGGTGMPGENEYLTPRDQIPFASPVVIKTRIPLETVRAGRWTFDNAGSDSLGDMPVTIPPGMLIPDESGTGSVLQLDGSHPLKMRLRTWPIGNTTVDFRLNPAPGVTKPQSVIGRSGWSDAININLLSDGRVEVVRDGDRHKNVRKETLVSKTPLVFGKWTRLRVTNDSLALRIYIDGRLDSESSLSPARSYGNSTWYIGGGHEAGIKSGYANYRGKIDDLTVCGAAFAPDDPDFPSITHATDGGKF
ncbi:endo-1,3-alpha-glucanase family glycosylhydrolase [Geminisphaera colitermitum]|uniref:endo-1,3-alpha-glucanase family glycosylhydrolase n=1 Tax=Geminisphaera colitermitum TaxID=1148786 RepID=UPI000158C7B0|nr:endo-1,3-alpha-glucanase family glycosylhydrolase [Geminisphaera colitermitum]